MGVDLDVLGGALGGGTQQGRRVGEDDRVVVAVDDARVRGGLLGDLVKVGLGGDAGADVEELAYSPLGEPAGGAVHEGAVDPGHVTAP